MPIACPVTLEENTELIGEFPEEGETEKLTPNDGAATFAVTLSVADVPPAPIQLKV